MESLRRILLAALLLLLACGAPLRTPSAGDASGDIVVLVSFDGFRHDYLDRGLTPTFAQLARAGVRADGLIPVFPTKTFPNHHSIATGQYAEHHGLVGNEFFDPVMGEYGTRQHSDETQGRWFGGEPIWNTAERQGVRSAAFFWVATDTDVGGRRPTYWKKYDGDVPYETRVDSVIAWLAKPESTRPRLVLLYFELMDDAGHQFGPDSPQVDSALVVADGLLARLLSGIRKTPAALRTHVVVVSDHGMAGIDPARKEIIDAHVDLEGVRVVASGAYSTLYFDGDTVRRNSAAQGLRRSLSHARVFVRDSIPAHFHWRNHRRIPDLLIVADVGWLVGPRRRLERMGAGGTHGYDPAVAEMRGIFLASGPRIRSGQRSAAFENVHIHPLIARLLGIQPAAGIDGSDWLASRIVGSAR